MGQAKCGCPIGWVEYPYHFAPNSAGRDHKRDLQEQTLDTVHMDQSQRQLSSQEYFLGQSIPSDLISDK